jgi:alkylation response protein AidB-like acyl-CoA dehydrogenase
MDFTLSDHQQAISDLAGAILGDRCPPEALRELEREADTGSTPLAADAWRALAEADLLGLAVPAPAGGSGLGVVEAALVAEQVGRHVALVPYWPTVAAAATLARWGTPEQHRRWLPGAVDGTGPLAVALWEPGTPGAATARPTVTATPTAGNSGGWRLDGVKQPVPWGRGAAAVLVPAALGEGGEADVALFAVPPDTPGVTIADERVVSREPYQTFVFEGARVGPEALVAQGPEGADAAGWLAGRTVALLCATALGVAEGALALTASHVTERRQFGAPIGTFQAVAQRSADAYIDTEAIRLTTWQAAWRLDAGLPAEDELTIAAFWVAEGGQRVVHAAQHLHGGIGVDIDYPVHRYFRWAKVLELLLGGASGSLVRLGASLAAGGPTTS